MQEHCYLKNFKEFKDQKMGNSQRLTTLTMESERCTLTSASPVMNKSGCAKGQSYGLRDMNTAALHGCSPYRVQRLLVGVGTDSTWGHWKEQACVHCVVHSLSFNTGYLRSSTSPGRTLNSTPLISLGLITDLKVTLIPAIHPRGHTWLPHHPAVPQSWQNLSLLSPQPSP